MVANNEKFRKNFAFGAVKDPPRELTESMRMHSLPFIYLVSNKSPYKAVEDLDMIEDLNIRPV